MRELLEWLAGLSPLELVLVLNYTIMVATIVLAAVRYLQGIIQQNRNIRLNALAGAIIVGVVFIIIQWVTFILQP